MKSPSESSNSWLSSNAVVEIEQYFLLLFTSVLGWWLVLRVRRHFNPVAGRTRTITTTRPTKGFENDVKKDIITKLSAEAPAPPSLPEGNVETFGDDAAVAQQATPSTEDSESLAFLEEFSEEEDADDDDDDEDDDAIHEQPMLQNQQSMLPPRAFFPPPGLGAPPGLENLLAASPSVSTHTVAAAKASSATRARCGMAASMPAASVNGGTPPPAAQAAKAATVADTDGLKAPKKKKKKKSPQLKDEMTEGGDREIGRCVCWRENGFGFLVDEDGERLFVRGEEVGTDVKLMPGQLVWFRRGKTGSGGPQATKAYDIAVVDVEVAKVLRKAERDGITWSKVRSAVLEGNLGVLSGIKGAAKAGSKTAEKKVQAQGGTKPIVTSGSKPAGEKAPRTLEIVQQAKGKQSAPSKEQQTESGCNKDQDADLRAFLGEGSVAQMRANLKYAPQWVTEKFVARHGA